MEVFRCGGRREDIDLVCESFSPSFFLFRVLQWSTFIDRTFCTETDDERRTWIESINKVSKDLAKKQKDEVPSTAASGGLKPTESETSPKQGMKVRGHFMLLPNVQRDEMC